jgi:hypothetical protein
VFNPADPESEVGRASCKPTQDVAEPMSVQIDAGGRDAENCGERETRRGPPPTAGYIRHPDEIYEDTEEHDCPRDVPARESVVGSLGARTVHEPLRETLDQEGAGRERRNPERPAMAPDPKKPQDGHVERDHDVARSEIGEPVHRALERGLPGRLREGADRVVDTEHLRLRGFDREGQERNGAEDREQEEPVAPKPMAERSRGGPRGQHARRPRTTLTVLDDVQALIADRSVTRGCPRGGFHPPRGQSTMCLVVLLVVRPAGPHVKDRRVAGIDLHVLDLVGRGLDRHAVDDIAVLVPERGA